MSWWKNIYEGTKKKEWKIVGEAKSTLVYGGLWKEDEEITVTVVFFEDTNNPSNRKVEILGIKDNLKKDVMVIIEPMIYRWRDYGGDLPNDIR